MSDLESMRIVIAWVAVVCGGVSCLVFVRLSLRRLTESAAETQTVKALSNRAAAMAPGVTVEQVVELAKALASLTDSLAKAGPALWSLIGSALFLLIACVAAGAITGGEADAKSPPAASVASPSPAARAGNLGVVPPAGAANR